MRKWRIWLAVDVWALAILIQKPLWFGQGGWFHVGELEHKLVEAKQDIEHEKTENEALVAEVRSLKEGTTAIEERARRELYMVRNGEVLFRVKASPEEQAKQAAEEAARAAEAVKAESRALEKANPTETDDAPAVEPEAFAAHDPLDSKGGAAKTQKKPEKK